MVVVALLITKWVHSIELDILNNAQPSSVEQELLDFIKEALEEVEYDHSESCSLAAGVARTWGLALQDVSKGVHNTIKPTLLDSLLIFVGFLKVWVWGITPRMGSALGLLADAYERVGKVNRHHSLGGVS